MDEHIPMFLAVTGIDDEAVAKQYLSVTNGDLEYAVTLFMESEGGPRVEASASSSAAAGASRDSDEEMAQRLQQEAYQDQDVRPADANVHRREQLVDHPFGFGIPQVATSRPTDIFGNAARGGIFNQRFDPDENQYYNSRQTAGSSNDDLSYYDSDDDQDEPNDEIMIVDSEGDEPPQPARDRPLSRRRRLRDERAEELNATQRRLAELFRPPFDLISPINIDSAKQQAKAENKWILINIQDAADFTSQVLNRDFWSKPNIKSIVKENFIFLQYHNDSPNGVTYTNFYSTDEFPHIAILDPLTGERVKKWKDGEVPNTDGWVDDVQDFLSKFSLRPDSKNPTVKHEVTFDPDVLSEEQQIEYAMKQSMLENGGDSASNAIPIEESEDEEGGEAHAESVEFESEEPQQQQETQVVEDEEDPFDKVVPQNHEEPTTGNITRIQIRFPNGKRLVHKFLITDTILQIFQWLKFILNEKADEFGLSSGDRFTLSNTSAKSFKFIDSLHVTVEEAGLRNASILLEKD